MPRAHAALASLALSSALLAQQEGSTALTIYSTAQPGAIPAQMYRPVPGQGYNPYVNQPIPGYAVVKQERTIDIPEGRGEIRFTDVAAYIEPTTVRFISLSDPDGTRVLEQDFRFDLVNQAKLLERYIDQPIVVEQVIGDRVESVSGVLLSAAGGLMLRTDGGIRAINGYNNIRFPELPGGLVTKPTLAWDLFSETGGRQQTRVTYQTESITWWADYNLVFSEGTSENTGKLDVGAWVSILNKSGATYGDAKLKLVAGDVQRAQQPGYNQRFDVMEARAGAAAPAGFEEKSFFEYHLYTLGRPATIPDNSTKQIELFEPASGVPAEKVLVYYGLPHGFVPWWSSPATDRNLGVQSNQKVDVYLKFRNDQQSGLGIPLPSGRIRVSKLDEADGTLEFIGEDVIDHTPKNEDVLIKLGSAFDVVGERTQTDFRVDNARRWMEEEIEIELRNHKDQPVKVIVKENLYRWVNWSIIQSTHEHQKQDARTIHFPVTVDADGKAVIRYRVRYTW
jgi:hypothetical protein